MPDRIGQKFGNYHLLGKLGEGGFAEVYLGEHLYLGTQAAIKVLHTPLGQEEVDTFRQEAQMIAGLIHPHIVRVLDYGVEGKTPYLVMDYAPNGTLRQRHPKGVALPLLLLVGYVKQVAEGLQYAHERKLIHRDIKPENMLLGRRNELLLSDFGIALVAQSSRYQSVQEMAGTMAYMAPEQIQGKPRQASDQYALGIVVYEWLSGERPFQGSLTELVGQHLSVTPPSLRGKVPSISSEMEEVVLRALAKDPKQRFVSVQAFAATLEQAYEAASAHQSPLNAKNAMPEQPPSVTKAMVATAESQTPHPTETVTPLDVHPLPMNAANAIGQQLPSTRAATPPDASAASSPPTSASIPSSELQTPKLQLARRAVMIGLAGIAIAGSSLTWLLSSRPSLLISPPRSTPSPAHSASTTSTTIPLATPPAPLGTIISKYTGHSDLVLSVAWSPDSKHVASASGDKTVQVWDATNGKHILTYSGHSDGVNAVAWSPDGKRIASASNDKTVQIWDATTGKPILTYPGHSSNVNAVAWSSDGKNITSGDSNSTIQIWNPSTENTLFTCHSTLPLVGGVAWSPDNKRIASRSAISPVSPQDGNVQVWDTSNGNLIYTQVDHNTTGGSIAWSPKGQYLAAGNSDPSPQTIVRVLNATTGNTVFTYKGHTFGVNGLTWSPDGIYVASGSYDKTVQVWNATTGITLIRKDFPTFIFGVAWSPNGALITSGGGGNSQGQTVSVWAT